MRLSNRYVKAFHVLLRCHVATVLYSCETQPFMNKLSRRHSLLRALIHVFTSTFQRNKEENRYLLLGALFQVGANLLIAIVLTAEFSADDIASLSDIIFQGFSKSLLSS